ncbi:DUF3566 domain-containing protein [Amycolatopsis sp. MtRt-6]|uniref:DUF3566 domain-containing protein n=1 Tax=Amycolatopsis sp. MtRt-6 TaxID=2792782 RepID=UPI001A8D65DF|nr:DUF3566 domain-containing protein [Amycolatopsis sp. MtRt-6]
MTPSENPEAAGSNGTPASPPWQRVDKEGDSEATVKLATEEAQPAATERQVVTGSAAPRLFGASDTPPASTGEVPSASTQRARPSALRRPGRGPRRASLQVKRFDPWSVLKLSLVLGVAMFFVWLVAVGVLYTVLDGMGVWDKLNGTYSSLVGGEGANASAEPLISAGRVFGIAAILGAINIVLVSALATVSAFIYNVSADLAGGLEVTLSERE